MQSHNSTASCLAIKMYFRDMLFCCVELSGVLNDSYARGWYPVGDVSDQTTRRTHEASIPE